MEKAMEALRKLEEKWKISTAEALLLFVCTAVAVVGLCATATAVLRKKRARRREQRTVGEEVSIDGSVADGFGNRSESGTGLGTVKQLLIGSVRGSEATKWTDTESVNSQPVQHGRGEPQWSGRSSPLSPLWQRRILMGEKCEMPRYSGLILYDERGRPLHSDEDNCQVSSISFQDSRIVVAWISQVVREPQNLKKSAFYELGDASGENLLTSAH